MTLPITAGSHEPASWRRRAFIVAAVVTIIIVAEALGGLAWKLRQAHRTLETTREHLTIATATGTELAESLDLTNTDVETTYETLLERNVELDESAVALRAVEADLYSTNLDRLTTGALSAATERRISTLNSCLSGVRRAIATVDTDSAVPELRAAQPACTEALVAGTGAVFPYDFPDPFVLRVGGTYLAFSTNAGVGDIQMLVSTDLIRWSILGNALSHLPRWAVTGATWAPSVMPVSGGYALYYTARERASGQQCISRAFSPAPYGPYVDDSSAPLICQHGLGGSIDPSPFVGPYGNRTLLWKSERPAAIWSQPLGADGTLRGRPVRLLEVARDWERGVIEAPSMTFGANGFTLLYSGNRWNTSKYAIGAARCASPAGPCTRQSARPILATYDHVSGPGGGELFTTANGRTYLAYAGYHAPHVGYPASRLFHLATVDLGANPAVVTPIP